MTTPSAPRGTGSAPSLCLVLRRPGRGRLRCARHGAPAHPACRRPLADADAARRRSTPAQPGADPISLLAWLFTPIFQTMFIILVAVYEFLGDLGVPAAIGWAIIVADPHRPGRGHPALPAPARLAAPDAAPPARDQGDPAALQGRPDQGAASPSRSCSRSAASARSPAACRCCSRCRSCSSCTRSSRTG